MARPRQFDDASLRTAALEDFWTRGFEGASIGDIASASGVGNGSIYAAYGSKLGLFIVVLEAYCRTRVDLVRTAMATEGPAGAAVRALLDAVIDDCATQPGRRGCLMLNSIAEFGERGAEVLELCRATTRDMAAEIELRLATGAGSGTREIRPVHVLGAEILLVAQGLIQASRLHAPADELRAIAGAYADRLALD
ncbi:TetR/AcrR family transcriptional regulator [Agromyces ramosus]|uniref:AcrR family transcriptional regulator n=1 Tax=Agromyces ramosus TaxID=33879 RepID=A0ABU0RAA3_9MICO|nr:TetR/AcrR family transcriptional regulator [Agromyces ramosus]MDQ0895010.1 AcrR family transcriptional regulator [Agromyces ramosus]